MAAGVMSLFGGHDSMEPLHLLICVLSRRGSAAAATVPQGTAWQLRIAAAQI